MVADLLEVSHGVWVQQNEILHEKHMNGLLPHEAEEPEAKIHQEFELGFDNSHEANRWLLEQGLDSVLSLLGHDQLNWLTEIISARTEHEEETASETPPVL